MIKRVIKTAVIVVYLFVLTHPVTVKAADLYFIDAHSQVDHTVVPLQTVISVMKQGGVTHTILSARGDLQRKTLLGLASQYPESITPAVRTKGDPYDKGSPQYYKMLKAQVDSGKYSAIAEILLHHAKKGNKAPEVVVYPEDKRVIAALSYAIKNRWPFVIHIEFGSLSGEKKKHFMESMAKMLNDHPKHPFILTHMGQLGPVECRRLIETHKNLHFHTGWSNPAAVKNSDQPWVNLFEGQRFASEWSDLFLQYPERIIFALDNVFTEHWTNFYTEQMKYWKNALSELSPEAAHLIAHGNAERLWRIPPKK